MPPRSDKPALNELLGDESARGIELAVTPLVFGGIGWLVDGRLGTGPWLALAFAAFALVGTIAKMWFTYDAQMRELESSGRWARRSDQPAPAPADDVAAVRDRVVGDVLPTSSTSNLHRVADTERVTSRATRRTRI